MDIAVRSEGLSTLGDPARSAPAHRPVPRGDLPPPPSPDAWLNELAATAATGDRQAVERLAGHIQPMIQRYCRARIARTAGGSEAADDIAQEACLGIFAALPRYYGKNYPFNALAYRIAANKVADHYRRQGTNRSTLVENPPELGDPDPTPEKAMLDRELSERLQLLLSALGGREREIITLRLVVGMSAEETAQAIGSTRGAIRVAQHRALAKLRALLAASKAPELEHA